MRQVRRHVDGEAVKADPVTNAHADGADLVLARAERSRPRYPQADPTLASLSRDSEAGQRADDPLLEVAHEAAYIAAVTVQVQHHINYALAGAVIGVLAAAAA